MSDCEEEEDQYRGLQGEQRRVAKNVDKAVGRISHLVFCLVGYGQFSG